MKSITNEQRDYLNELRESGEVNMFGATPYIMDEFDVDKKDAREILSIWMDSYRE